MRADSALTGLTAGDIMTPNPVTIGPADSVREALGLMVKHNVRHLPVVADGTVVGMLSDRDIRQCAAPLEEEYHELADSHARLHLKVSEVMSTEVVAVAEQDNLKSVMRTMIENRVSGMPVVAEAQGRALVGILSYIDILIAVEEILSFADEPEAE
jgi:acetoin utilization protein AcuB